MTWKCDCPTTPRNERDDGNEWCDECDAHRREPSRVAKAVQDPRDTMVADLTKDVTKLLGERNEAIARAVNAEKALAAMTAEEQKQRTEAMHAVNEAFDATQYAERAVADALATAQAAVDIRSGKACEEERAIGNGGCGMCAWCCKQARDERDAATIVLSSIRQAWQALRSQTWTSMERKLSAELIDTLLGYSKEPACTGTCTLQHYGVSPGPAGSDGTATLPSSSKGGSLPTAPSPTSEETGCAETVATSGPRARDACQICHGKRGGEPGNENIVDGVVMCDDCHCDKMVFDELRLLDTNGDGR